MKQLLDLALTLKFRKFLSLDLENQPPALVRAVGSMPLLRALKTLRKRVLGQEVTMLDLILARRLDSSKNPK
jgi:hypothetical protein